MHTQCSPHLSLFLSLPRTRTQNVLTHFPQFTAPTRSARLQADFHRMYDAVTELQQMEFFKKTYDNNPETAIFMSVFDGAGRMYEAGNAVFEKKFIPSIDFLNDSCQHKTFNTLLLAALMAPEDRILWFRMALEVCMTSSTRAVHFVKVRKGKKSEVCMSVRLTSSPLPFPFPPPPRDQQMFDRQGQIRLYILEVRLTIFPGSTDIKGGIVIRIEPAPSSRHVHAAPGYRDLVKVFATAPKG